MDATTVQDLSSLANWLIPFVVVTAIMIITR